MGRVSRIVAAALAPICLLVGAAHAQSYPDRPVKLVVPFPAGGPMDVLARLVTQRLTNTLGQQFVIDNRAGAGATLGTRAALAAPPDGYTLLWGTSGSLAIARELYAAQNYDPVVQPVAFVAKLPHVAIVNNDTPVKTMAELVAWLKANPGKYNFAGTLATPPHLIGALFKAKTGVDITYVPYTGSAAAVTDLIGGRVQLMFDALTTLRPLIESGKVRGLAVLDGKRWPTLPDIPTMPEAGFPDMTMTAFTGVVAQPGTPRAIVDTLNRAINEALSAPEAAPVLAGVAAVTQLGTPEDFGEFIKTDTPKWRELVRIAGAKAE